MTATNNTPENPYRSAETDHGKPGRGLPRMLGEAAVVLVVLLLLAALLMPAVRTGREPARRNSCINNTKQIMLSLLNYESAHGEFPPAYTVDEEGNRLHSWRTLLLPYIEGNTVHELIDFTKPWDHEANAAARQVVLEEFMCPSSSWEEGNFTSYVAIVGPECVFTGSTPTKINEVSDGTSNTLMIVEVADRQIEWMEPRDITLDELLEMSDETKTNHGGIFIAGYVDGHAEVMSVDMDRETLKALATKAGDEKPLEL